MARKTDSSTAANTVRNIRRNSRKRYSGEEKIRIVLEGLRGEETVAELCRREGISESVYYRWSKEFLEAGKQRLVGNTKRQASSDDVAELCRENDQLKQLVAELALKNRVLKKVYLAWRASGKINTLLTGREAAIMRLVERSNLSIKAALAELGVPRSSFYRWYLRYQEQGPDGLSDLKAGPRQFWNRIPQAVREQVVQTAFEQPEKSPRELAWHLTDVEEYFISESSVYRILKAYDLVTSPAFQMITAGDRFDKPTKRVNEMWQTDFTQFKVISWGLKHIRGAPYHPMTQGKIERYHRSMKNVVKPQTFYFPWELEHAIGDFVTYYNDQRYHESLDNMTPADLYFGRAEEVKTRREQIKLATLEKRRRSHRQEVQDKLYWERESSLVLTSEMSH